MIDLKYTNSGNPDFIQLVKLLDKDLSIRDGDDHAFYDQFNKIDAIKYVIIAYEHQIPVGCGAIKAYDSQTMEVKRMYVDDSQRGKGIATLILSALEKWAESLGYNKCILETGIKQPEAIALYKKNGYSIIPNYGQYENVETSVCFEKELREETIIPPGHLQA
ncbi:MAG: GNAT family N-acetyltransferase [Saprospiraceae bacterium]|nr:GNAT family N-acetyltransferase [Saprospiraceae bacterium]